MKKLFIISLFLFKPLICLQHVLYDSELLKNNTAHRGMKIEEIYRDPRIILIHNFLKDNEAEEIIKHASGKMSRSRLGGDILDKNIRNSSTAGVVFGENSICKQVLERAADIVGTTAQQAEFQVVRYKPGQQYRSHHDYFPEERKKKFGVQRVLTLLLYLNDVKSSDGGCTEFPLLGGEEALRVKPQKNTALVWSNLNRAGLEDVRTLHKGSELLDGEKWAVNIWFYDKVPSWNKFPYNKIELLNSLIVSHLRSFVTRFFNFNNVREITWHSED